MKRTKIIDVLKSTEYGKEICVKGWVRTHRSSKAVDFIALNDGSTIKNVQVVVDPSKFDEQLLKDITTGACICAVGTLVESQGAGQTSEVQATALEMRSCVISRSCSNIRCRRAVSSEGSRTITL